MKQIRRSVAIIGAIMVFNISVHAQQTAANSWEVGAGIGYANYYGDLSNYRINHLKDFYRIYKFAAYNKHYVNRPSVSLLAHKKLNNTVGVLLQANALQFGMSDRYRHNDGSVDEASPYFARSLNFRTNLYDLGFALSFSPNNGRIGSRDARFYPSFYAGLGLLAFSVRGDLYDQAGNQYNYNTPGHINDDDFETNLRSLKTERSSRYSNIAPYLNLGLALNFRVNYFLRVAIQSDIKYSGTDYLDDVSKTYKTTYPTAEAAYAAKPGFNIVDPATMRRGDDNGVKDIYINNRLVVFYTLNAKRKPKAFKAPIVYSVQPQTSAIVINESYPTRSGKAPLPDSVAANRLRWKDSAARTFDTARDSMARKSALRRVGTMSYQDSLMWQDSLAVLLAASDDTTGLRGINTKLKDISQQLQDIRTVLRNQALIPRYQQLTFQLDSLNRLLAKQNNRRITTATERMQQRVYLLQQDSVRAEMQRLLWLSQYPAKDLDSATLYFDTYRTIPTYINNNSDTVTKRVDRGGDTVTKQQPAMLIADTAAIAYNKDDEDVDSRTSNSVGRPNQSDSVSLSDAEQQTFIRASALRVDTLERSLRATADSLVLLQQRLKATRDSAAYYRRTLFAMDIDESDTVVEKKKWYQKIIPQNKKKREAAGESEVAKNYRNQEERYNAQTRELSRDIERLQRNNRALANDYDNLRRRQSDRNRITLQPPAVVLQPAADKGESRELRDLREEISALKLQLSLPQNEAGADSAGTGYMASRDIDTTNGINNDSLRIVSLRADFMHLQKQLDSMRIAAVPAKTPAKPVTQNPEITPLPPAYDVSTFPVISVYFGMNSSTLASTQAQKLSPLVAVANKNKDTRVLLTGFTDPVGNITANKVVARRRLDEVKRLLVSKYGVDASRIVTQEPDIPVVKGPKKANPLDRRVDLKLQ
jgi:outer membrane protein OmpA-like peptidoglycan-associated protein